MHGEAHRMDEVTSCISTDTELTSRINQELRARRTIQCQFSVESSGAATTTQQPSTNGDSSGGSCGSEPFAQSDSPGPESQLFTIFKPNKDPPQPLQGHTEPNDERQLSVGEKLRLARLHYLTIPNAIRTFTVLFCLGWFLYVAYTTLKEFRDHETIIFLEYQTPTTSKPPATTVCTHCLLCGQNEKIVTKISARELLEAQNIDALTHPSKMPPRNSNINILCNIYVSTMNTSKYKCDEFVAPVVSMQEGRKCYTYFSDIFGQTSRAMREHRDKLQLHYDQFPQIMLKVTGDFIFGVSNANDPDSTYDTGTSFTGVYISLHQSDILPDMYNIASHQMIPGKATVIPFSKRIQRLLSAPYATKCFSYDSKYENYTTGSIDKDSLFTMRKYRTRGECFLHCMWNKLNQNENKCANFYSIYDQEIVHMQEQNTFNNIVHMLDINATNHNFNTDYKVCAKSKDAFERYIKVKANCLDKCPDACMVETFYEDRIYDMEWPDRQSALAIVTWAPEPVTQIIHRPKWELTDFLGTIGGQAHIWLGVSIIHIIWFVIKFIRSGEFLPDTSIGSMVHWWRYISTENDAAIEAPSHK